MYFGLRCVFVCMYLLPCREGVGEEAVPDEPSKLIEGRHETLGHLLRHGGPVRAEQRELRGGIGIVDDVR